MSGKRMKEPGIFRQELQIFFFESYRPAKFSFPIPDFITHPFQLKPGKIPGITHSSLGKIFLDTLPFDYFKPISFHSGFVGSWQGQLRRRNQIHLHRLECTQSVSFGMNGPAMVKITNKSNMNMGIIPAALF